MPKNDSKISKHALWIISLVVIILIILSLGFKLEGKDRNWGEKREFNQINYQDLVIKNEVQTAISMVDNYYRQSQSGKISLDEAKLKAADALRNLRYGDSNEGYFWADTSQGVNVVLYGNAAVEGKNRYNSTLNGVDYIKLIISNGMQSDGGYTAYAYPKMNQTEAKDKKAYSKYYAPFDWVIGTGYYLEDFQ